MLSYYLLILFSHMMYADFISCLIYSYTYNTNNSPRPIQPLLSRLQPIPRQLSRLQPTPPKLEYAQELTIAAVDRSGLGKNKMTTEVLSQKLWEVLSVRHGRLNHHMVIHVLLETTPMLDWMKITVVIPMESPGT